MTRLTRPLLFAWLALSAHALPSLRTRVTREDGTQWAWGYNDRGEVTSGGKKFSDGTAQPLLQFGYQYDGIGNRTQSDTGSLPVHSSTYTPNSRNQYVSRTVPPYLSVTGEAAADANVVVQAKPALRNSAAYWKEWSVDNTSAGVRENVRIAAAKPGAGAGGSDLASLQTGQLYLPPATESFTYEDDGNLTSDSRWSYSWDAENRLLSMEEKTATLPAGWVRQRVEFAYDAGSRRTRKTVKQWTGIAWSATSDTAFVYDGWNLIAEVNILVPATPVVLRTYAWGLDISQTLQGAGGVGGLLWAQSLASFVFYPAYDGNGNVIGYVDASNGQPSLKLDYDPFGVPLVIGAVGTNTNSTTAAKALPFRFSTKYQDRETGLNYYGYRYYAAGLGRWINRDPIGERGGVNMYGFVGNNVIGDWDYIGLSKGYSVADSISLVLQVGFKPPSISDLANAANKAWSVVPVPLKAALLGPAAVPLPISASNGQNSNEPIGLPLQDPLNDELQKLKNSLLGALPKPDNGPFSLGADFLFGTKNTAPNFSEGSYFQQGAASSLAATVERERMRARLIEYCETKNYGLLKLKTGSEISAISPPVYPFAFLLDLGRNPTSAFLGSFTTGKITASNVQCGCQGGQRSAQLYWDVTNLSGLESASHPRPNADGTYPKSPLSNNNEPNTPFNSINQQIMWQDEISF